MVQNEGASTITLEEKAISQTVWYGSANWVFFLFELLAGWRLDILMLDVEFSN